MKLINSVIFVVIVLVLRVSGGEAGEIIVDSESLNHQHHLSFDEEDGLVAAQTRGSSSSNYRIPCPGANECVLLLECPQMLYEASKKCFNGDKSLLCGVSSNYEPYVCCPRETSQYPSFPSFQSDVPQHNYNNYNNYNNPNNRFNEGCGKSLIGGSTQYKSLGAYPFAVRIGFKNTQTGNLAYPCSGSIISKRVILTAGHCALAKAEGHRLSSVRVGEFDTTKDPDCVSGFCAPNVLNHAISHVVVHPEYQNGQYHNDIALLILKTPINYTVAAQPICLKRDRENLVVGKRATIIGWGKMSLSSVRSPSMQFLEVPLASWDTCLRVYGSSGALDSQKSIEGQWMCAGGEGKDACQGYGGAPLLIKEDGISQQVGIMSFGSENCGGARIPSVYTSIPHFYQWIQENMPVE